MWTLKDPTPVRLVIGILASGETALSAAMRACEEAFGPADILSDTWPFDQTDYYRDQMGAGLLRRFISFPDLIDPSRLARIKLATNEIEQALARDLAAGVPRPVNLDPGYLEPSKLVLASAKNFSHRIYLGSGIYAEITLIYEHGWKILPWTFPDYRLEHYHQFFSILRETLVRRLREST